MTMKSVALAASTLILGTAAAHAGGYVPPVVETAPAPVVIETPVGSWQGGYAGLTLGYAFSGKDRVGLSASGVDGSDDDFLGDVGELKLSGANAGVRLGYRWQRDNWVFGPELSYEGGSIKDDISGELGGVAYEAKSEINSVLALRLKTGYAVRPDTLIYGIAGVARADVDYEVNGVEEGYKHTGYVVGLGVEKQLNDKWSVTGEYEYASFGKEGISVGDLTTEATAKYNNVKVGVNFRF
ncbi:outer membrane protein [Paracoccus yeei]|uniref:outer membrane protein n=1 Tax=Paracoccus yeei TaxID=147645 RepID=UPI0004906584|nr:outer membrane beta-barrel protein [Paracoccus yeei]OWJ89839.1 porin family protein [Paracoccus yeei]